MDLTSGEEVKLGLHHLSGNVSFKLTTAQLKKIQAAAAAGRGTTLKLTKAQIAHHAKHGEGVMGDMAREGLNALKPALKGAARGALGFAADKGADFAKKGVDKAKDMIQSKLENLFGIQQGSGMFHGTHCTPAMLKKFQGIEEQQGSGFLSGLLGSFGLGIKPGMTFADQHGAGFLSSLLSGLLGGGVGQQGKGFLSNMLKKLAHGGVDVVASALGGGIKPPRSVQPKKGKGFKSFLGNIARKGAHGAVDLIADTMGGNVRPNPLANPNEQIFAALTQKKVAVGGSGLYLPGGRGLYMP
jgi:hypothetical protein